MYSKGVSDVNLLTKFVVCSSILNDILSSEEKVESYEYEFKYHDIESNEYFATPKPLDKPISLNEGFSYSFGVNGYVTGGTGVGRNTWDIRSTVGGTFSSSTSYSQTNSTYLDINGDGYPDYITQKGKKLKIYLGNGKGAFGSEHSIDIANYRIDNEETSTSSTGKNVYVGAGLKTDSISFGYKFNENKSNSSIDTDSMFIDVDGDGLVDFVLDTKNYLHNESNGTSVKFTQKNITNFPDFIINKLTLNEKKDLSKNYPMNRPLRAWRAPYAGEIEITESLETQNRKFIANTYLPDNTTQTISTFLAEGFLCRGGIVYGDVYYDLTQNIIFGPAVNYAYKLESEIAIYPNIILEDKLAQEVLIFDQSIKIQNPLASLTNGQIILHNDITNRYYLNYLNYLCDVSCAELGTESYSFERLYEKAIAISNNEIIKNSNIENVVKKHQWQIKYLNEIKQYRDSGFEIDPISLLNL